jgi:DNA-binding transcriptional MerR regulator
MMTQKLQASRGSRRTAAQANLTIGQLARTAGVSTSMLRFYEREGLLAPARRTGAGYRLYPREAMQTLLFIHRAQRLGFSLADIRLFLQSRGGSGLGGEAVAGIAQQRLLEIERRSTELLVLRHELELFLDDLPQQLGRTAGGAAARLYRNLIDHVCGHEPGRVSAPSLHRLMQRLGCSLAGVEQDQLLRALRGQHLHVWKDGDGYAILVRERSSAISAALRALVDGERGCHAHVAVDLVESCEGLMLTARGENAFLFAQLFLALEAAA